MVTIKLKSSASMYIDELNNVRYSSDFEMVLGKVTDEFRFIPDSSITNKQGLTPEMLIIISELIKHKAGIGVKKAESID